MGAWFSWGSLLGDRQFHPSPELAPLFTGTQERSSCHGEVGIKGRDTKVNHSIKADIAAGLI